MFRDRPQTRGRFMSPFVTAGVTGGHPWPVAKAKIELLCAAIVPSGYEPPSHDHCFQVHYIAGLSIAVHQPRSATR